ncbi:MAG: ammonium transporter [Actinobacteria bacterium]|nr:ammonium transporter [Actinomycetota bacterium]
MGKRRLWVLGGLLAVGLAWPSVAFAHAAGESKIDTGDTTWLLASAALVMLMTPAVGFFYGGLVRKKNVLSTIFYSFLILALISVQWVVIGYSLAFGPSHGGVIGGFDWIGLNQVGLDPNPDYAATVPHQAFMAFQMFFAVITPALITGAFAERKRFKAFLFFSLLWATLVYDPMAHWVWGVGGWLRVLGAVDFAGGTVVHITSGVAALVAALVLGKRLGLGQEAMEPHDSTMTVLGAALLWFGWFGFNAGSALTSGSLAAGAFVATNTAAAMAALTWMTVSWLNEGKPSAIGGAIGAVAGLVAVTPAAGFVSPMGALFIGLGAGVFCYLAVLLKRRLGFDDALDVFACHGVGGIWGALATGLFATKAVNPAGVDGLLYGNPGQLGVQALAALVAVAFSGVVTFILLKLIDVTIGLRVPEHEEMAGLDTTQHGEVAYQA